MANYPQPLKKREELNLRLGIKSSLPHLRAVVAAVYSLFIANDKKSKLVYSEEYQESGVQKLRLPKDLSLRVTELYGIEFPKKIELSPLFTSQIESLQVGLELFFHLAKINYTKNGLSERTGSSRFQKEICFTTNMLQLDLFLSNHSQEEVNKLLLGWLDDIAYPSKLEDGLSMMLSIFSEDVLYKIRTAPNEKELFFQREGIYEELKHEDGVINDDAKELVGPYRIFKAYVGAGIHPFLQDKSHLFSLKGDKSDFINYSQIVSNTLDVYPSKKSPDNEDNQQDTEIEVSNLPLQQIVFGAPGTGKSFGVERDTYGYNVIRTTFHPDTDYSTFVGTYKPIMVEKPVMTTIGTKRVQVEDEHGEPVTESQIEYKFVPQAFAQAYVEAWQDIEQPVFLVIEEINRGNCAQIFGDIFQLLDRRQSGYSAYYITPDKDLQQFLKAYFAEEGIDEHAFPIIASGEKMCLPPNLYIWATMNTSDQSLFPIDSAFKRRWEWKYIKIKDERKNWTIAANGFEFDWWSFLNWVNGMIGEATSSEDKKLGYFFAKADKNGVISATTFVSKVIFYLTNDVFKDYNTEIFNVNNRILTFQDFYDEEGNVDEAVVEEFLRANDIADVL